MRRRLCQGSGLADMVPRVRPKAVRNAMRIAEMNWMQVEAYLASDDRCVLPIGSTEQHAQLSLFVDAILAERVAVEAAEPLGVPVYPAMPFGLAPYFLAFPGTISLRVETLLAVVRDFVASAHRAGFRRVLIVNGHGGNLPVGALAQELMAERPSLCRRPARRRRGRSR